MRSFMLKPTRRTPPPRPASLRGWVRRGMAPGGRPQVETADDGSRAGGGCGRREDHRPVITSCSSWGDACPGKVLRQVDSEGAAPLRSTGQPLPVEDRAFMERRFGYDFSKECAFTRIRKPPCWPSG